ncbi:hypothetical protein [Streptomyces collinus]|uniref:hypothetical protein n=1 Tax=Streptomyces collinus TaxID=42684 RepID=UPI00363D50B7
MAVPGAEGVRCAHRVPISRTLSRWPGDRALYDLAADEPRAPGPGVACRFHYCGDTP